MNEATMTDADMKQRENIVKSMKKNFKDFRKRYGANAKNVMYATATKMAMKEAVKDEADKGEEEVELDEGKWDYPKHLTQTKTTSQTGSTNAADNRARRKAFRKKAKAAAHKKLMSGMKNEEVELDEISKELAWKAAHKALEKTRVAAYGSLYGGSDGHKRFQKAVRQHKKISDYAYAKTPKVPYVREEEQMDENLGRGNNRFSNSGSTSARSYKSLFRPPAGFTKKGIEKGGGVKTVYHYTGKSNTPSGATIHLGKGAGKVNLGKTPTKRRVKEELELIRNFVAEIMATARKKQEN